MLFSDTTQRHESMVQKKTSTHQLQSLCHSDSLVFYTVATTIGDHQSGETK